MRVTLARHAVRGPAGVGDAEAAVRRIRVQRILELAHLTDRSQALQLVRAVQHGHARRVVASILQPPQPFDQDGDDVTIGDGADDSTHERILAGRGGAG